MNPLENLYRAPYEMLSAITMFVSAFVLFLLPFPQILAFPVQVILASAGLYRGMQGWRIMRYRWNLKRLPYYTLRANEVPYSEKALFIGKGFQWDQRHTQRLFQVRQPAYLHLSQPGALYKWARLLEIRAGNPHSALFERMLSRLTSSPNWFNPVRPLPPVGGDSILHGIEPSERDIYTYIIERYGHILVLGTTRVGKTRLAEILITQDIHRGDTTIVFDPKGDADLLIRMYIESERVGRPFYIFHLGHPDLSSRYNPIGNYSRITEVATRIANQLPGEGQSAAFKEFVWRFVNVLARCMEALGIKPTYKALYQAASGMEKLACDYIELWLNKDHPQWKKDFEDFELDKKQVAQALKSGREIGAIKLMAYIKEKGYQDPIAEGLNTILANDRSYFEKLVSSLYPLLEKLTTGNVAELISPDLSNLNDSRPVFDWATIIQNQAVVYVGLDSLSDYEVAGAVGNAMFSDLTSLAGQIYKFGQSHGQSTPTEKRRVAIHADEFNELIGDEFIPMLNKAGGAGYQVTVYTQTWSDVEAKIGSSAKAAQIAGNLNTLIMLRVKTRETAEILTNQLPEVHIQTTMLVSGASDVADPTEFAGFTSRNEDRITTQATPMLQPADLTSLPKGQAFALIEGGHLYKLRLPMPLPDDDKDLPRNIQEIALAMEQRYRQYAPSDEDKVLTFEGESYAR